jgi:hypothetical protein
VLGIVMLEINPSPGSLTAKASAPISVTPEGITTAPVQADPFVTT